MDDETTDVVDMAPDVDLADEDADLLAKATGTEGSIKDGTSNT